MKDYVPASGPARCSPQMLPSSFARVCSLDRLKAQPPANATEKSAWWCRLLSLRPGPQQSLPFSEIAAKGKIARRLPAKAGNSFTPLAALGISHISVLATGNKDARSKRVWFGTCLRQRVFSLAQRLSEVFQRVLKPLCLHNVQSNMYIGEGQFCRAGRRLPSSMREHDLRRPDTSEISPPGTRDAVDLRAVPHAAQSLWQATPKRSVRKTAKRGSSSRWRNETVRLPKLGRDGQLPMW